MKYYLRLFWSVLFSFSCIITCYCADLTKHQADSIIKSTTSKPLDNKRLEQELALTRNYRNSTFAKEFTDLLYDDACTLKDKKIELVALSYYFNIEQTKENEEGMNRELKRLKEQSFKYQIYDLYFRVCKSYITKMASSGKMEWTIDKAKKLYKIADDLNENTGRVCANMALAQAYKFMRDNQKVIDTLKKIDTKDVEPNELMSIQMDLYSSYYNLGRFETSLTYLSKMRKTVMDISKNDPTMKVVLQDRLLFIYSSFADTYMRMNDYDKAHTYLIEARKYYNPNSFLTYFAIYHSSNAAYYAHVKKWNECFAEIDESIVRFEKEQPLLKQTMVAHKAKYLEQAGRWKEALALYDTIVNEADQLNKDFMRNQEETIHENYRWEKGLLDKARYESIFHITMILFFTLIIGTIACFAARSLWVRSQLIKAKKEEEDNNDVALRVERLKKMIVDNVTKDLQSPIIQLQKIIDESDIQTISANRKEISSNIYELEHIIDKILELSELQADCAKFNNEELDLISVCHEAIKETKEVDNSRIMIQLNTKIESQFLNIDKRYFLECFTSSFVAPSENGDISKIDVGINYSEDGMAVVLDIVGSPLSNANEHNSHVGIIQNSINKLIIESFGGKYEIVESVLRPQILISIPHNGL